MCVSVTTTILAGAMPPILLFVVVAAGVDRAQPGHLLGYPPRLVLTQPTFQLIHASDLRQPTAGTFPPRLPFSTGRPPVVPAGKN